MKVFGSLSREDRVPLACGVAYLLAVVASGANPASRATWFLENMVPFIIVILATYTYRQFRFSDRAYCQGLAFLLLHTVATWYTYPLVPFGDWLRDGFALARNNYDRVVHFAYGALLFVPLHELLFRREPRRNRGTEMFLTVSVLLALGTGYEFLEWWAALINRAASDAFIATQGDVWDVQLDLFVALVGATLAAVVDAVLLKVTQRPRESARGFSAARAPTAR